MWPRAGPHYDSNDNSALAKGGLLLFANLSSKKGISWQFVQLMVVIATMGLARIWLRLQIQA